MKNSEIDIKLVLFNIMFLKFVKDKNNENIVRELSSWYFIVKQKKRPTKIMGPMWSGGRG